MMTSEFIDRIGFMPTASEYAKIAEGYYDFGGDKDGFCKAFVKNGAETVGKAQRAFPTKGEQAATRTHCVRTCAT